MKRFWMVVLLVAGAFSAPAALIMTIEQDNSDLVVTASGTANTDGLNLTPCY